VLTGTIPSELGRIRNLRELKLGGGNRIEGTVPMQLCDLLARNESCFEGDGDEEEASGEPTCFQWGPLELTIDCDLVACSCGSLNCTCDDADVDVKADDVRS
jgi:hypothetical protein